VSYPRFARSQLQWSPNAKTTSFPSIAFPNCNELYVLYAYVLRFIHRITRREQITADEMQTSQKCLVTLAQRESFPNKQLTNNKGISAKSRLFSLCPFIHSDGTLRVGGRLQQSNFEFDKKHPSILDSGHYLTNLIFHYEHTTSSCGAPILAVFYS
jgi:hypothetical protein